jgi:hypothetical protein
MYAGYSSINTIQMGTGSQTTTSHDFTVDDAYTAAEISKVLIELVRFQVMSISVSNFGLRRVLNPAENQEVRILKEILLDAEVAPPLHVLQISSIH